MPRTSKISGSQRREQRLDINVATAEDDPDAQTTSVELAIEQRGDRDGARWLDEDLDPFPDEPHRLEDLGLGRREDLIDVPRDHGEGEGSERRAESVGERLGVVRRLNRAELERAAGVVGDGRLRSHDAQTGPADRKSTRL